MTKKELCNIIADARQDAHDEWKSSEKAGFDDYTKICRLCYNIFTFLHRSINKSINGEL